MSDLEQRIRKFAEGGQLICTLNGTIDLLEVADRIALLERRILEQSKYVRRYLWLRQQSWDKSRLFVVCGSKKSVSLGTDCPSLDRLDEAIDSEMIKENKNG